MSQQPSAVQSGSFRIGGDLEVHRLGFGAMRLTGKGIWGEPEDVERARATLRRVRELDITFVDTADSYGPHVSEQLIREVLHPYGDIVIATKGGLLRTGANRWVPCGKPAYLRQAVHMSLRRLGVERIDLWQLHRVDPEVPADEQFAEIAAMQKEGLIRHVGLSEVGVDAIEAAGKHFVVATVQNEYNLVDRKSEAVLDYCTQHAIGFIPWFPLANGDLARPGTPFEGIARRLQLTASQLALAWILRRSPVMLPIPGTSRPEHLEENVRAAGVRLSDADFEEIDRQAAAPAG